MDPRHRQLSTSPFVVCAPSRRGTDTSHPAVTATSHPAFATPSIALNITAVEPTNAMLSNHLRRRIRLSTPDRPRPTSCFVNTTSQLHERKTCESICSYSYLIRTLEGCKLTVRTLRQWRFYIGARGG